MVYLYNRSWLSSLRIHVQALNTACITQRCVDNTCIKQQYLCLQSALNTINVDFMLELFKLNTLIKYIVLNI